VHPDWELVVNGQHYPAKRIYWARAGQSGLVSGEYSIAGGQGSAFWVYFDTPPGRAPDQQADAFMKGKDVRIFWRSFNTQIKLQ
jgi:hypothetical protein